MLNAFLADAPLRSAFSSHGIPVMAIKANSRATAVFCLLLLSLLPTAFGQAAEICGRPIAGRVEILRDQSVIGTFAVALADSPRDREQGLMDCPVLAPGTGMRFVYPDARRRVFWMKNTLIELAIVFISNERRIAAIAHGEPGSLEHIYSPGDIACVLEINFAESRFLNIGDRVRWNPIRSESSTPP
ncbi:hypothetical protein DESC_750029 [Desulfosarcina cetonica]|uniref:DUF192 domain-containing protein n=1 Tax=Desulfosarcina cetonica TaxID=90730 RepID=UPI0006D07787|nr:DUF192 domain-containing protein [Desulfosarcina cetonica]VTR69564.1 hypothetical protein DESC_750029 [Desulfosarcina cetonica]